MSNKKSYIKDGTAITFLFLCLIFYSCKKLVDVPPPTQSLAENKIYTTDATAIGVLDGMYANLTNDEPNFPFQGRNSIGLYTGLSADELNPTGVGRTSYYRNDLGTLNSGGGSEFWAPFYNHVYKCNAAIEGLQKSTTLSPAVKQQLLGEAKFMRVFFISI